MDNHGPTESPLSAGAGTQIVAAGYSPEMTARYREEVQGLLHTLFDNFLQNHEPRLYDVLQSARALDAHEGALLIKAMQSVGIRFQLTAIAEEIADTRKVRLAEASSGPEAVIGSFHRTLGHAAARGTSAADVQRALAGFQVSPTITAHPTEAKRITILENHRRIYRTLVELETNRWTPRERERLIARLRNAIVVLWMTGELRLERPTVDEEVSWGLHFFNETLIESTADVGDKLAHALRQHFPDIEMEMPPFLRFHSGIGGDRDGNPGVTTTVTRRTLRRHRDNAISRYVMEFERLSRSLSISAHVNPPGDRFRQHLRATLDASGRGDAIVQRNPYELFRQFCVACTTRLRGNLGETEQGAVPYRNPEGLISDLRMLESALTEIGAGSIASGEVATLRYLVMCFGFRTAALDIRQNADVINRTVAALGGDPQTVADALASGVTANANDPDLDAEAAETVALFRLLGENRVDPDAIGAFILSKTTCVEDVLAVAWLAAAVDASRYFPPIVPLFETVEDLHNAPGIIDRLLANAVARTAMTDDTGAVEVMLGYSNCIEDSGYLTSIWETSKAQAAILDVCQKHGVALRFFHGRGGSISRGGAPTGRAIAAQPSGTVQGRLRVTEQGEVVSAKYSNRGTARTHLELLGASVLRHSLAGEDDDTDAGGAAHNALIETLSGNGREAYRDLLETPGFPDYFRHASPVEELALLKSGSHPSQRVGGEAIDDLRAIPWVFAWGQNRHLLTGWYGVGSALDAAIEAGETETLRGMYGSDKTFKIVLDEVEKTLYQVDLGIARRYAGLVPDDAVRERIFGKITTEYDLVKRHLLTVTEQDNLADRFPSFRRRIDGARPLLDRCNAWQVNLLRRNRLEPPQDNLREQLLLSMHCIATGLGWTG